MKSALTYIKYSDANTFKKDATSTLVEYMGALLKN